MVVPTAFVADASFTMPWVLGDEQSDISEEAWQALKAWKTTMHVPSLWLWELTNVLVLNEKRGRIASVQVAEFLAFVKRLPIQISSGEASSVFTGVPPLMRTHSLTAYDAAYLQLAKSLALPLATLGRVLIESARCERIALVRAA